MIVLYKGSRGKGKTLTMVKDGLKYNLNGLKVFRNFKCKFGTYISNDTIIELDKFSTIKDCVLMIDEIQIFFDNRQSMRKQNIRFSNFVQQIRKRHIILLCTTQFSNTIDMRLRQHIDVVAYPNFIMKWDLCEVTYMDLTAMEDDLLIKTPLPKIIKIVYDCKPIYNLYETDEIIA